MNSCVFALVADACSTMATIRATTVSPAARLTRTRSAPVPLRVPANTSSPGVLSRRQRLAGDGGLVHVAGTGQHLPVGGDALARPDQDHVADPQAGRVHGLLAARLVEPGSLLGREVEQAAHRLGGAVGGHRLQGAGGSEDDDQQAAVKDLPDRRRADRREHHQQVHVQGLAAQRPQARQPRLPPACRVAGQEERPRHRGRSGREMDGEPGREHHGGQRRPPHLGQRPQPGPPRGGRGRRDRSRGWGFQQARGHYGLLRAERRDPLTIPEQVKTCSCVLGCYAARMGHKGMGEEDAAPAARLDAASAAKIATTLQALATPSRLMILTRLREAPCTVTDLAESAGMEQSAVSHQLRLLRNLGLVTGTRSGKNIVYALYDNHVAALLDQAVYHIEHLRLGIADTPADAASRNPLTSATLAP